MFLLRRIENLGGFGIRSLNRLGRFGLFLVKTVVTIFTPPFKFSLVIKRIYQIGSSSMGLILLIAAFTGAVLGLQIHYQLVKFGAGARTGTVVSLSLIRELGPVVCALMVAGRAGTALASELGVMQISEQVDAMKIMNLNPFRYLMAPIFLASIISVFLLTAFFNVVGITGGFVISSGLLGLSPGSYYSGIIEFVAVVDIINGAIKSLVFGGIIAWVSCYKGYYTGHGAEGVGKAATESMVLSSILILVFDYIMTSIMFTG